MLDDSKTLFEINRLKLNNEDCFYNIYDKNWENVLSYAILIQDISVTVKDVSKK